MSDTGERRAPGWPVAMLSALMVIACILWNLEAHTRLGVAVLSQQYMALQLGLAIAIVFLHHGADVATGVLSRWRDRGVALLALLSAAGLLSIALTMYRSTGP